MLSTLLGQVVKPEACAAAELGFDVGFVAEDMGTGEVKVMIVDTETGLVTHEEVICQAEDLDVVRDATVMIQLAGRPETATPLRLGGNEIMVDDNTMIFIQACDETFAHIGIRTNGRVFYRHYSFPGMEMDKERRYPDDLSDKEFAKIIDDNKARVVQTIEKLNQ